MPGSRLSWYWHRLRAMSAAEMALHARKKWRQQIDGRRGGEWPSIDLRRTTAFPNLRSPADAPDELRRALQRDRDEILAGRWRAFGAIELQVDDPPRWHKDYLANVDLSGSASKSAFKLNHRALPDGADIKLIWELSRWYHLVRLAMAAYVLEDRKAAETCVRWLGDWVQQNPAYRGWNWTSALESGMRLIQFTWIDALLRANGDRWGLSKQLDVLCEQILPAHAWFTWRHQSFGSSANNHLIGELAGLIMATVRWPALAHFGSPLNELQRQWEEEVLAQFAEDGGNKEQALNYQLFSFEFCWQVRMALVATGRRIDPVVDQRLNRAARFFWEVQSAREPWDYGDSDSAYVTPFCASEASLVAEWRNWMANRADAEGIRYWIGEFSTEPSSKTDRQIGFGAPRQTVDAAGWWLYPKTGVAVYESGFWWLRWDLSPLGYLATAAHGHLDALHLSIWWRGVAFVVDPGTGAYYGDKALRNWLASRAAHNAPCPAEPEWPRRLGPFLWEQHHEMPRTELAGGALHGSVRLETRKVERSVRHSVEQARPDDQQRGRERWEVTDACFTSTGEPAEFSVRWQFAPGTTVKRTSERGFVLRRQDTSIELEVSADWSAIELVEQRGDGFEGVVSPSFRKTERAPFLKLTARPKPGQSCVFTSTFVASGLS